MDCFGDWEIGETPDMAATAFSGFANDIDRRSNENGLTHALFYVAGKRHGLGQPLGQEQASAQWDVLVTPIFGGTCLSGPLFYVR